MIQNTLYKTAGPFLIENKTSDKTARRFLGIRKTSVAMKKLFQTLQAIENIQAMQITLAIGTNWCDWTTKK